MTIRDTLVAKLAEVAGTDVHIIPFQDSFDIPERRTIMLKQTGFSPLPEAPRGGLRIDYTITFISPATDAAVAEAELDKWVPECLDDMHDSNWFVWTSATKVLAGKPGTLAYDVDSFVTTKPKNTTRKE